MDSELKNAEGYYDLTAYKAIRNIIRDENRRKWVSNSCYQMKIKRADKRRKMRI